MPIVVCEQCGGEVKFTAQIPPLGNYPGNRIHECLSCGHFTWTPWVNQQQQQQQQQQQPPSPPEDDSEPG